MTASPQRTRQAQTISSGASTSSHTKCLVLNQILPVNLRDRPRERNSRVRREGGRRGGQACQAGVPSPCAQLSPKAMRDEQAGLCSGPPHPALSTHPGQLMGCPGFMSLTGEEETWGPRSWQAQAKWGVPESQEAQVFMETSALVPGLSPPSDRLAATHPGLPPAPMPAACPRETPPRAGTLKACSPPQPHPWGLGPVQEPELRVHSRRVS